MENEHLGILLILLGISLFCIQDIFIKLIIINNSILQILVFRAILGFILLTGYLYLNQKRISYKSNYPFIALICGTFFSRFCLFLHIPYKNTIGRSQCFILYKSNYGDNSFSFYTQKSNLIS